MRPPIGTTLILTSLAFLLAVPVLAQEKLLQLPIGDPARKDRESPLVLDAVTDTKTGDLITPDEMVKRLAGVRLLLVGNTAMELTASGAVLGLVAARRRVGIGLGCATRQRFLDQWGDNRLTSGASCACRAGTRTGATTGSTTATSSSSPVTAGSPCSP
jgi:hypothetical protein